MWPHLLLLLLPYAFQSASATALDDKPDVDALLGASLVNATQIRFLDITGTVPPEIGMLCPEVLNFESNQLMAATAQDWEFMTFLTNCTRLRNLCIQANALGGVLPSSVGNLSAHLQQFIFGFNEISGKLPFGISNLVGLNVLDFPHNQFTDVLPDSIGRLNLLQQLYFNNNQFSGSLPSSLGNLTRLLVLSAGSNKFKGGLPTGLGNLQEITEADFSNNKFSAECEALSKVRHRYLISVITCCSSSDSSQNDFKALMFEFMPNGNLDSWLHPDVHDASQQLQGLTLIQRLNIAVGIADALDYLHNNCEPPIVHCDLKPSNILLNEDLVAHVGDFGLAKIISEPAAEQLINSKSSTGIRGTIGYVAPEYGEGGQVSSRGDVYSFGSVVLELFIGKAPTHDMFRDGLTLQKHAKDAFPGMLMQIVDPVLLSIEEASASSLLDGSNPMEHTSNAISSVIEVALSCSKHAPTERMCIGDAAAAIHRIRDSYVRITQK
ncbi:hypothetical protein VPH35_140788 [Triticum aestivum]|uniref:non-specific serine/threonine protein kinase n=1 Tax=Aegilops tauschii TaxID=37682 RepID=M8BF36_AEGTA